MGDFPFPFRNEDLRTPVIPEGDPSKRLFWKLMFYDQVITSPDKLHDKLNKPERI
jgi:hypothetical protein